MIHDPEFEKALGSALARLRLKGLADLVRKRGQLTCADPNFPQSTEGSGRLELGVAEEKLVILANTRYV